MAPSNTVIHDAIVVGEQVPQEVIMQLVEQQVVLNRDNDGIVIDGYPRDLSQMQEFESKVCIIRIIFRRMWKNLKEF